MAALLFKRGSVNGRAIHHFGIPGARKSLCGIRMHHWSREGARPISLEYVRLHGDCRNCIRAIGRLERKYL